MQRSHERAVMMCPASSSSPMRDVLVVRTRARTMLGFFLLRPAGGGGRRAAASVAGVEGVGRALSERARSRDAFMRGPKQPVVSSDHSLTRCGAWRAALQQQSARQFCFCASWAVWRRHYRVLRGEFLNCTWELEVLPARQVVRTMRRRRANKKTREAREMRRQPTASTHTTHRSRSQFDQHPNAHQQSWGPTGTAGANAQTKKHDGHGAFGLLSPLVLAR